MIIVDTGDNLQWKRKLGVKNPLTISLAFSYAFSHAGPKLGIARSPTGGGVSGQVSGKTPGIGLSEGEGKGLKAYDVMVGLRTFPSLEKPLVAGGGPRDVDEGSTDDEENLDGREKEDETMLLAGGRRVEEGKVEFWASATSRRTNREHRAEKECHRNIFREGRRSWVMARTLAAIIYPRVRFIFVSRIDKISCSLLLSPQRFFSSA